MWREWFWRGTGCSWLPCPWWKYYWRVARLAVGGAGQCLGDWTDSLAGGTTINDVLLFLCSRYGSKLKGYLQTFWEWLPGADIMPLLDPKYSAGLQTSSTCLADFCRIYFPDILNKDPDLLPEIQRIFQRRLCCIVNQYTNMLEWYLVLERLYGAYESGILYVGFGWIWWLHDNLDSKSTGGHFLDFLVDLIISAWLQVSQCITELNDGFLRDPHWPFFFNCRQETRSPWWHFLLVAFTQHWLD